MNIQRFLSKRFLRFLRENIGMFLSISFVCFVIIFFYEHVKKKIKHKKLLEIIETIRLILILSPMFGLSIMFVNYISKSYDMTIKENNLHLILNVVFFIIGNLTTKIFFNLVLERLIPPTLIPKTTLMFLIPFIHSIVFVVYILIQFTTVFENNSLNRYIDILRNKSLLNKYNTSVYILFYIMFEMFLVFTYVIVVYTNKTNPKVMELICSDGKFNKSCYNDVQDDVFKFSMLMRLFLLFVYIQYMTFKSISIFKNKL